MRRIGGTRKEGVNTNTESMTYSPGVFYFLSGANAVSSVSRPAAVRQNCKKKKGGGGRQE